MACDCKQSLLWERLRRRDDGPRLGCGLRIVRTRTARSAGPVDAYGAGARCRVGRVWVAPVASARFKPCFTAVSREARGGLLHEKGSVLGKLSEA